MTSKKTAGKRKRRVVARDDASLIVETVSETRDDDGEIVETEDIVSVAPDDAAPDAVLAMIDDAAPDNGTAPVDATTALASLEEAPSDDPPPAADDAPARRGPGRPRLTPEERERRARERAAQRGADVAPVPTRTTKAELAARLVAADAEQQELRARLDAYEARADEGAVQQLADALRMAAEMGCTAMASKRGPHWLLTDDEATQWAAAGSVALAPYAKYLSSSIPWVVFVGVTWKLASERLRKDAEIVAAHGAMMSQYSAN